MRFCQSHPFLKASSIHPAFPPPHIHPHNANWKRLSCCTIIPTNISHSEGRDKSKSGTLTASGRWPRHHSGHSRQTAGCADPGPHAAPTTGQGLKLRENKTRVTAMEDCRKCNNSSANHTAKAVRSITSPATNRRNQGN